MDWSLVVDAIQHVVSGMPLFAAAIIVLVIARFVLPMTTTIRVDKDLLDEENPAAALFVGGYLFSVALALLGALFGRGSDDTLIAMAKIVAEGGLAIALLVTSIWIHDRFVLHRFCITKELQTDKNLGTGFSVSGSCIASGLILNGALTGFSQNFTNGLLDICLLWFVGQIVILIGTFAYHRVTRYDVHELIEYDDNTAVGISFGALLVGFGLVIRAAIVFAGVDTMIAELTRAVPLAIVGMIAVLAASAVTTRLLSAKIDFEDEVQMHGNTAVSIVAACASIAVAMLFASIIQK